MLKKRLPRSLRVMLQKRWEGEAVLPLGHNLVPFVEEHGHSSREFWVARADNADLPIYHDAGTGGGGWKVLPPLGGGVKTSLRIVAVCVCVWTKVLKIFFLYMDPLTHGGDPGSQLSVPRVPPPSPYGPLRVRTSVAPRMVFGTHLVTIGVLEHPWGPTQWLLGLCSRCHPSPPLKPQDCFLVGALIPCLGK